MNAKYVIIIPDGAADKPLDEFDGQTIFEAAKTPAIDAVSSQGQQGTVRTIPPDMQAGSDVAMMSLLGYNPLQYYTGRAPIEAAAQNIALSPQDWVFRCNLVTIANGKMADHSAGHISTGEATLLINQLAEIITYENVHFYPGVGYRHLCVVEDTDFDVCTQPPHDIIGENAEKNLPRGKNAEILIEMMARSQKLFENHDINRVKKDLNENQVSSIWLWGQGKKAQLGNFQNRFGLKGVAITAVDLVRGLSKLIGFDLIKVDGATGYVDTNYEGKGLAAIDALDKYDIVMVHVEAPDEAGHAGNAELKKKAVEQIDKYIVAPILEALQTYDQWRILVMPDHPTPIATQAHSSEPVPFAMAGANVTGILNKNFSEANAIEAGFAIDNGFELMEYFLRI